MTLFERVLGQAQCWLTAIDEDRDRAAVFVTRYGGSDALDRWLDTLEDERAKHLLVLDGLEQLRRANHPVLLLEVRPRMLKVDGARSGRHGNRRPGRKAGSAPALDDLGRGKDVPSRQSAAAAASLSRLRA